METSSVKIPEGVKAEFSNGTLTVSGKSGKCQRAFDPKKIKLEAKGSEIALQSQSLMMLNTAQSHVTNMMKGVSSGYSFKLQTLFSHFPVSYELKGRVIMIKNFLGEKKPRSSNIIGDTKVEVKGTDLFISGPDKENVGQTLANLKTALKIKNRDSRVFQDGVYVVEA